MADEKTPRFHEEARRRFKTRLSRMQRLMELDAPDIILANEIHLVVDSAKALLGDDFYRSARRHELALIRNRMGFCREDGCDNLGISGETQCEWHKAEEKRSEKTAEEESQ